MAAHRLSSISKADSYEKIGEFWDTHDFTDFDDPKRPDVEFSISHSVPIEAGLFNLIADHAQQHGVSTETLVNLWLQQKVEEISLLPTKISRKKSSAKRSSHKQVAVPVI